MGKRINNAEWLENQKRWQINVQKDGVRRSFYSSDPTRAGKREANRKADLWLDDGIDGGAKVQKLYDKWIAELKATTSTGNWYNTAGYFKNYVLPKIGNKKMESIHNGHLQDIILNAFENPASKTVAKKKMAETGKVYQYKEHLSEKTLRDIRGCIIQFIKYARKHKATQLHPEDIDIPKTAPKSKKGTLQPDDLVTLFSDDQTTYRGKIVRDWYINAYRYAVVTGMRPGEIIGLEKCDFSGDFERCQINRSINTYMEETAGKNKNACRSYVVPQTGRQILRNQAELLKKAGIITPYIFPAPDGTRSRQDTYRKYWRRYRDHHGIADRTPYEMRHTWWSVNKEIPVELLKPMGGHSKDFDSMGTYGHAINGEAEKAAEMIDSVFQDLLEK